MVTKEKYYQLLSTTQIKRDCETLLSLSNVLSQPILALSFLPFYALFADEIQNTIGDKGDKFVIRNDSPFDISEVRAKLKLFGNDKINKSKKRILSADFIQNEIFSNKLRLSITKYLNIHYNLGIFYLENGRIIGNTQYFYYMFQGRNFNGREYKKEEIRLFGQSLGTVIGSVSDGLKDFKSDYKVIVKNEKYNIKYKDFNTNKSNFSSLSVYGKEIVLLLLHVLSAVNFIRFILENELPEDNSYLFKVKYITMYYALGSIKKVLNYYSSYNIVLEPSFTGTLEKILFNSELLLNSDFRSCMMHYEFISKGNYLIKDEYLNYSIPFYGLIQTFFSDMKFSDFNKMITDKIIHISDSIENLLKINNNDLKEL
jgi:hypothetical protein